MSKVFLTSDMGLSEKIDGIKYPRPINNKNHIIEQIKENLQHEETFMFITSSPSEYEVNDNYANLTFDSFNMSGFSFKNNILVDYRYNGNLEEDIARADVIFLSGGHTPTEMAYFEEIELRDLLKDYKGVIIGQSAGSLNLANTVVCAPEYEEEIGINYTWRGLEKTNINIEPHFTLEVEDGLDKQIREELLKLSEKYSLYAICDGTHIYDDGINATLYGEAYYLNNNSISKICNDGKLLELRSFNNKLLK